VIELKICVLRKAMEKDIKINVFQHTAAYLKKRSELYRQLMEL